MKGAVCIGRGSRQRALGRSPLCNQYKVSVHGVEVARQDFLEMLLSGTPFVCHCSPSQACHADSITAEHRSLYPHAYDRDDDRVTPSSVVLNRLAELQCEPDSDSSEYTTRDFCDGQTLASAGLQALS